MPSHVLVEWYKLSLEQGKAWSKDYWIVLRSILARTTTCAYTACLKPTVETQHVYMLLTRQSV